jgi:hypothetical protein
MLTLIRLLFTTRSKFLVALLLRIFSIFILYKALVTVLGVIFVAEGYGTGKRAMCQWKNMQNIIRNVPIFCL